MSKFRKCRKQPGRGEGQYRRAQCGQSHKKRRNEQEQGQAAGDQGPWLLEP